MKLKEIKKIQTTCNFLVHTLQRSPTQKEVEIESGILLKNENLQAILDYKEKDDSEFEIGIRFGIYNNELRKLREEKKLHQKDLSLLLGFAESKIGLIENFRCFPSEKEQKKIADFFSIHMETLFPQWMKIITEDYKQKKKKIIIPVKNLRLQNEEVLQLEAESYSEDSIIRDVENSLVKKRLQEIMISQLTPREKQIIELRTGLNDDCNESMTFEQVGRELNITRERVRQIEAKAHEKMRQHPMMKNLSF